MKISQSFLKRWKNRRKSRENCENVASSVNHLPLHQPIFRYYIEIEKIALSSRTPFSNVTSVFYLFHVH